MEKYAWKAIIKDGMRDEYIKRHNNIWQEMKDVLGEAGIVNYSIWICDNIVFGYYECSFGIKRAQVVQKNSPVVDKWNEYMKDVMVMEIDKETGAQPLMENIFNL